MLKNEHGWQHFHASMMRASLTCLVFVGDKQMYIVLVPFTSSILLEWMSAGSGIDPCLWCHMDLSNLVLCESNGMLWLFFNLKEALLCHVGHCMMGRSHPFGEVYVGILPGLMGFPPEVREQATHLLTNHVSTHTYPVLPGLGEKTEQIICNASLDIWQSWMNLCILYHWSWIEQMHTHSQYQEPSWSPSWSMWSSCMWGWSLNIPGNKKHQWWWEHWHPGWILICPWPRMGSKALLTTATGRITRVILEREKWKSSNMSYSPPSTILLYMICT